MSDDAQTALRTRIASLDAQIAAHEDTLAGLRREHRALTCELAALLSPIPVGALVEVPKGRYRQGRYRITEITLRDGEELVYWGDKLAKDGSVIPGRRDISLWLARAQLRQVGGEA